MGELGFSSDLASAQTVERKRHKYAALIGQLRAEGWRVDGTLRVITVGTRATVPISNDDELRALGVINKRDRQLTQHTLAKTAGLHLNRIIRQYRILCARRRKSDIRRTGVG